MATARALALGVAANDFRGNEQIEDSELVVTSARAQNLRAFLPAIEDGTGTTVDNGYSCRVQITVAGTVEILDVFGRRVGIVPAYSERVFTAGGDATNPVWIVTTPDMNWSVGTVVTAAGSSTPALGTTGPAASGTVIWYQFQKLDGTIGYIATWS